MLRNVATAVALATSALGLLAPPAFAAVTADCNLLGVYIVGYAMSDTPGASLRVRCVVRLSGATVWGTPLGPAGNPAFTHGPSGTPGNQLCVVWTGTESGEACKPYTPPR